MFKVIVFNANVDGFWLDEEKDFRSFGMALDFAVKSGLSYKIYRDFWWISALSLVARSSYDKWSR